MKEKFKKIIEPIFGFGLAAIIITAIISVIAIFGGAIMKLFGFKYNSIGSIILYFIVVTIVGFPVDIILRVFSKVLISIGQLNKNTGKILFVVLDTMGTCIVMAIVDYFMKSVSATDLAILVISFISAIFSIDRE
ncbi:MAG: YrvL family regulatory protein [Clostridium sp.]|uniref:YrvL family regulatory protein n=1 Tax=Clostridium sp. TaxID=1506 RepID=UPI00290DF95B|nr:YrvL family regulatory protein [Clostridium sp.]